MLAVAVVHGGLSPDGSQFCGGVSGLVVLGPKSVVTPLAGPHQRKPRRSAFWPWITSAIIRVLLVPSVMFFSFSAFDGENGAPANGIELEPTVIDATW